MLIADSLLISGPKIGIMLRNIACVFTIRSTRLAAILECHVGHGTLESGIVVAGHLGVLID